MRAANGCPGRSSRSSAPASVSSCTIITTSRGGKCTMARKSSSCAKPRNGVPGPERLHRGLDGRRRRHRSRLVDRGVGGGRSRRAAGRAVQHGARRRPGDVAHTGSREAKSKDGAGALARSCLERDDAGVDRAERSYPSLRRLDESPHVYRRLADVLAAQEGTVEVLHTLKPLIVVMAGADEFDPYKD